LEELTLVRVSPNRQPLLLPAGRAQRLSMQLLCAIFLDLPKLFRHSFSPLSIQRKSPLTAA
jgi:hypothetical protein